MNEKVKRKEWVKNVAIIFLAVLLVLTFCSNTIMNYSLPEVAAQYCYSGEITNRVRGTGYINADDPYSVVYKQTRKVDSVKVRVGDEVQKGDELYALEEGESEELKKLREQYELYLLKNDVSDTFDAALKDGTSSDFSKNRTRISDARDKVEKLTKNVENAEKALEKFKNGTKEEYEEYKALADAEELKKAWETQNGYNTTDLESAKANFGYDTAKSAYEKANANYNSTKGYYDAYVNAVAAKNAASTAADTALTAAGLATTLDPTVQADVTTVQTNYDNVLAEFNAVPPTKTQDDVDKALAALNAFVAKGNAISAEESAEAALKNVVEGILGYTIDTTSGETPKSEYEKFVQDKNNYYTQFKIAEAAIDSLLSNSNSSKAQLEAAEEKVKAAQTAIDKKTESLTANIEVLKKNLESATSEYTRLVADVEGLAPILTQIAELEKEEAITSITAPVSGTIISLSYTAGQTIETGSTVATIQVAGKGYTMELTVSPEQASLVSIGDEAEITNSWWYSDVHARVSSIKPNPQNPQKERVITFQVEGDVSSGQSLSVSVGQRTASYDFIVPKSALREDDNGKFVLRIKAKSTPLGNRYIAERVDIKVLAEDETRAAISGDFESWDYIITNRTKPVEDGQQVRLKD